MYRQQLTVCLLLILCLSQLTLAQDEAPTVAEIIAQDTRFTVLQRMIDMADPAIAEYLDDPAAGLTFFAPTNEAMEAVFGKTLAVQQAYADAYPYRVNEIIRLHIIPAAMDFTFVTRPRCREFGTMLINTQQYLWMDEDVLTFNQVSLPIEVLQARNGYIYPINTVLPKMKVEASAGDHTPDEQKRPKPLPPHFGDMYPDAPLATDRLSTADIRSVLEEDGRFTIFLRLLDASPQYESLLKSDGIYTLFIPTDSAIQPYFEESAVKLEGISQDNAETLIAQRIVPGYMTLDYIKLGTTWSWPLELCTIHWLDEIVLEGEPLREMEVIVVDFAADTGLTANGGIHSESPLYARNAIIYVTEEFYLAPGRG